MPDSIRHPGIPSVLSTGFRLPPEGPQEGPVFGDEPGRIQDRILKRYNPLLSHEIDVIIAGSPEVAERKGCHDQG
jgi:hypothetical protein